jgi:hypothetical protein
MVVSGGVCIVVCQQSRVQALVAEMLEGLPCGQRCLLLDEDEWLLCAMPALVCVHL